MKKLSSVFGSCKGVTFALIFGASMLVATSATVLAADVSAGPIDLMIGNETISGCSSQVVCGYSSKNGWYCEVKVVCSVP
ncbi:MAG: hypothetical protein RBT55_16405 [Rhodocyclaceae bacterium]|jgi:hypothetical protein|nr:hypothetical protein [Xanthomonadaceae bacterium]MDX9701156.1 hypothetical protein [Rhodocyclaceae bacterium]